MALLTTNNSYKQFISQVKQAKLQGVKELRLPIKQAENIIMDISLALMDKIIENQNTPQQSQSQQPQIDWSNISLDGGSFKKD